MADKEKPEDTEDEGKPKGGKMKKLIMLLLVVLVVGGGGAAGGWFAAGAMGGDDGKEKVDPDRPKLVLKDGSTVDDVPSADEKSAKKAAPTSAYKVSYHQIEQPFTSNLRNSNSFAQVSLAISTYYDERVVQNILDHEIAIRSAVLMVLAEQDRMELETQMGKQILQKKLANRINEVLQEKAGFGGVEDAYFTNFVVQ
ncbi:MAG: flagellar basal body-associated FliL family protein [Pseudomonadota bacterium]